MVENDTTLSGFRAKQASRREKRSQSEDACTREKRDKKAQFGMVVMERKEALAEVDRYNNGRRRDVANRGRT